MKANVARPRFAALVGACLLAGACAPTVTNHGYRLDPAVVAQIKPGVTSREEVATLLGSPSSVSTFDDKSWYYVTQRTEQMTFYQESVAGQNVMRIDFDNNGLVQKVDQRGLQEARNIEPTSATTRTMGNELTIVQQFVGNIGRFNTDATSNAASATRGRVPGSTGH